jgi:hypothetical protein
MKNYLGTIIIFFLLAQSVQGQILWQQYNGPYSGDIYSFATIGDTIFASSDASGIYKSIDDGITWENTRLDYGQNAIYVENDLLINEKGYSINYGKTWNKYKNYFEYNYNTLYSFLGDIYAGSTNGVFKFNREAKDWVSKNNGIKGDESWQKNDSIILSFVGINKTLFCGTFNKGLFYSKNRGELWEKVPASSGISSTSVYKLLNVNDTLIAMGYFTNAIYLSSDTGKNWHSIQYNLNFCMSNDIILYKNTIFLASDSGLFKFDKKVNIWRKFDNHVFKNIFPTNNTLLASNTGGLYRWDYSTNCFVLSNTGLNTSQVSDLNIINNTLYAATSSGTYYTSDNGKNWNNIPGTQGILSRRIIQNDSVIFIATLNGIYTKTLKSTGWTYSNSGLNSKRINDICVFGKNTLVATMSGPYISKDYGKSWLELTSGYGQTTATKISSGNGMVLTASSGAGLYKLSSDTAGWVKLGFSNESIETIEIVDKNVFIWKKDGLFKSSDSCKTWTNVISDIHYPVYNIVKRGGNLYASSCCGYIYYSMNDGNTWKNIAGIVSPHVSLNRLIQTDSCFLAASSHMGIWKRDFSKLAYCNSTKYKIVGNSITNVPLNATIDSLKNNIALAYGASCEIIRNSSTNTDSIIKPGDIAKIIAEDGKTYVNYNIQVLTSVNEVQEPDIEIYPTITQSKIFFLHPEEIKGIVVYNILGVKLMNLKFGDNSIDVSNLKPGVYLLSIIRKDSRKSNIRFVKE